MLKVENLSAWYGQAQALRGINLQVEDGQLVTLVGRNGAGKTTTLRCIMGLHRQVQGRITLDGVDLTTWPADRRARAGLGYVQDDRGIYATLTVEENLLLPPAVGPAYWSLDRIYEMFPILKTRRRHSGAKLSGGEQQMLAIA
ncbi:MAG TPA: ATP-binding cassette domain-containing protein, partial [Anaerolineae bacterium]